MERFFIPDKRIYKGLYMEKACCFTGHRIIPNIKIILPKLKNEVERLIVNENVVRFLSGGAVGFDMLAAEVVLAFRQNYGIKLSMILPCMDQDKNWNGRNKKRYRYILENADEVKYLADEYYEDCMRVRNIHMVDHSDYCIAYLVNRFGGTYFTVNYALQQEKQTINIANL